MLKNYFRIAWRNVVRHKAYAFINISGLAVGIAACIMLFAVVKYELSYDKLFNLTINAFIMLPLKEKIQKASLMVKAFPFLLMML